MELGGGGGGAKGNAITTTTTIISTKNLEVVVKPHTNPDPEAKTGSDPSPVKKLNQKQAKYRECQKNHAVSTGGHVVDGCCEFMSGGEEGTLDALKCAACKCHRSFHRKEVYGHRNNNTVQEMVTPAFYCSSSSYKAIQPRGSVLYPTGEIGRRRSSSSSEDMKNGNNKELMMRMMMRKKKRVRTKINEEQKEKMKEFAERLGWRMLKKDEEEIDKFCKLVNLRRQVFKVWMHNNKQAIKRRNCNTSSDVQNLN